MNSKNFSKLFFFSLIALAVASLFVSPTLNNTSHVTNTNSIFTAGEDNVSTPEEMCGGPALAGLNPGWGAGAIDDRWVNYMKQNNMTTTVGIIFGQSLEQDIAIAKNFVSKANANGIQPIIRMCVGGQDCTPYKDPQNLVTLINSVFADLPDAKFSVIAGPNEPDLEHWSPAYNEDYNVYFKGLAEYTNTVSSSLAGISNRSQLEILSPTFNSSYHSDEGRMEFIKSYFNNVNIESLDGVSVNAYNAGGGTADGFYTGVRNVFDAKFKASGKDYVSYITEFGTMEGLDTNALAKSYKNITNYDEVAGVNFFAPTDINPDPNFQKHRISPEQLAQITNCQVNTSAGGPAQGESFPVPASPYTPSSNKPDPVPRDKFYNPLDCYKYDAGTLKELEDEYKSLLYIPRCKADYDSKGQPIAQYAQLQGFYTKSDGTGGFDCALQYDPVLAWFCDNQPKDNAGNGMDIPNSICTQQCLTVTMLGDYGSSVTEEQIDETGSFEDLDDYEDENGQMTTLVPKDILCTIQASTKAVGSIPSEALYAILRQESGLRFAKTWEAWMKGDSEEFSGTDQIVFASPNQTALNRIVGGESKPVDVRGLTQFAAGNPPQSYANTFNIITKASEFKACVTALGLANKTISTPPKGDKCWTEYSPACFEKYPEFDNMSENPTKYSRHILGNSLCATAVKIAQDGNAYAQKDQITDPWSDGNYKATLNYVGSRYQGNCSNNYCDKITKYYEDSKSQFAQDTCSTSNNKRLQAELAPLTREETSTPTVVKKGDVLGKEGNTGYVISSNGGTGKHLHFGLSIDGNFADPCIYLKNCGGNGELTYPLTGPASTQTNKYNLNSSNLHTGIDIATGKDQTGTVVSAQDGYAFYFFESCPTWAKNCNNGGSYVAKVCENANCQGGTNTIYYHLQCTTEQGNGSSKCDV